MAMIVSAASIANLNKGAVVDRYAGQRFIVGEIYKAISSDITDDEIRQKLGKEFDFVVSNKLREEFVKRKALAFYLSVVNTIKTEVLEGRRVSINDFATFYRELVDDSVLVGVGLFGAQYYPIKKTDEIITEERTASIKPGSWQGQGLDGEYESWIYAEGSQVDLSVKKINAADIGIFNSSIVSASAAGESREYEVGGLNIAVFVRTELRPWGGDVRAYLIPATNQAELFEVERVNFSAEFVSENVGTGYLAMGPHEWDIVSARSLNDIGAQRVAYESFYGICAHNILESYPRRAQTVRPEGYPVLEVRKKPMSWFADIFGFAEEYLRSIGAWPEIVRNKKGSIKAEFRKCVFDAISAE